jgi:hypothetical protein
LALVVLALVALYFKFASPAFVFALLVDNWLVNFLAGPMASSLGRKVI